MNQRALVGRLQLDKSSMVYVIDELERQGLAERRRDPRDRRSYQVSITDAGRDRVAAAAAATAVVMDRMCEPLSGPDAGSSVNCWAGSSRTRSDEAAVIVGVWACSVRCFPERS